MRSCANKLLCQTDRLDENNMSPPGGGSHNKKSAQIHLNTQDHTLEL